MNEAKGIILLEASKLNEGEMPRRFAAHPQSHQFGINREDLSRLLHSDDGEPGYWEFWDSIQQFARHEITGQTLYHNPLDGHLYLIGES